MSTLAKNLKDSNGNVILPKTRSEQVYRPDNVTVESSLVSMNTSITNISNDLSKTSSNGYYEVTHSKSGTVHTLTNLPDLTNITLLHATFKATADYVAADTISINNKSYTCKLITQEDAPDNLFKTGSIVTIHIDLSGTFCFFNYGGGSSGGGSSNPPDPNTYQLSELITTTRNWSPPQSGWFRIFCVGKSGNGGTGGTGGAGNFNWEQSGMSGGGAGGGGSGGVGIYELYIKNTDVIPITITTSLSSFGEYTSATAGSQGTNGTGGSSGGTSGSRYAGTPGNGGSGGVGTGGNIANLDGYSGGRGCGTNPSNRAQWLAPINGGNDGGLVSATSSSTPYCSGGGGARYATHNGLFSKYVMTTSQLRKEGYCGGIADASGVLDTRNTNNQQFLCGGYFGYDISHLLLTGGGWGGHGGQGSGWDDHGSTNRSGAIGKTGCPGCIIIEKSVK